MKPREKASTLTFVVFRQKQVLGRVTVDNTVDALQKAQEEAHITHGSDHLYLVAWTQATPEEREQASKAQR